MSSGWVVIVLAGAGLLVVALLAINSWRLISRVRSIRRSVRRDEPLNPPDRESQGRHPGNDL
jgi:hypothetical protein